MGLHIRRVDICVIEYSGRKVDPRDKSVLSATLDSLTRLFDDTWQFHSGFVERGFGPCKSDAIVRDVDDQGLVVFLRTFENIEEMGNPLIESRDGLVVLCQLRPTS